MQLNQNNVAQINVTRFAGAINRAWRACGQVAAGHGFINEWAANERGHSSISSRSGVLYKLAFCRIVR